jgi:hypothetical protein
VERAARTTTLEVEVPNPTPLRVALRRAGQAPEGCLVLAGESPVPLDTLLVQRGDFTVVVTFSGG